jgi:hypothetical protein
MKKYSTERTGWRDEELSRRHREWGPNCPAMDLDFVLLEYDNATPKALIEYKNSHVENIDITRSSYTALIKLADNYKDGPLPCLIAVYETKLWTFKVYPLNKPARKHYEHCAGKTITERRFVHSIILLRGRALTAEDEKVLSTRNDVLKYDKKEIEEWQRELATHAHRYRPEYND